MKIVTKFIFMFSLGFLLTSFGCLKAQQHSIAKSETANQFGDIKIPTFKNVEIQKIAEEYTYFVSDFIEAYTSQDHIRLAEISNSAQEWLSKMKNASKIFSKEPEEAQLFSDYALKLANKMQSALRVEEE